MHVRTYVTEELHTYHDQITGVTNYNTMVLRTYVYKMLSFLCLLL